MDINNNRHITDVALMDDLMKYVLPQIPRETLEEMVRPLLVLLARLGWARTENLFESCAAFLFNGEVTQTKGSDIKLPDGIKVEAKTITAKDQTGTNQSKWDSQTAQAKLSAAKKDSDFYLVTVTVTNKAKKQCSDLVEVKVDVDYLTWYYLIPKWAAFTEKGTFRKSFDFKYGVDGQPLSKCPYHQFHFTDLDQVVDRLRTTPRYAISNPANAGFEIPEKAASPLEPEVKVNLTDCDLSDILQFVD